MWELFVFSPPPQIENQNRLFICPKTCLNKNKTLRDFFFNGFMGHCTWYGRTRKKLRIWVWDNVVQHTDRFFLGPHFLFWNGYARLWDAQGMFITLLKNNWKHISQLCVIFLDMIIVTCTTFPDDNLNFKNPLIFEHIVHVFVFGK